MGEKVFLKRRDIETNFAASFKELREDSDLYDITLGCSDSDGKTIEAHKVVLSACSTYFKKVFRQYSNYPKPFIYLKGVSFKNLSLILDFVYNGEVNVSKNDLDTFLAVT